MRTIMKSAAFCVVFLAYLCSQCCSQETEAVCSSLRNEFTSQIKTLIRRSEDTQAKLDTLEASQVNLTTNLEQSQVTMEKNMEYIQERLDSLEELRATKLADYFHHIHCEKNRASLHLNGSCYKISLVKATWKNAQLACVLNEGHLLKTETYDEFSFIKGKVTEDTWVGLSDEETAGTYKWEDGSTLNLTSTADWWHPDEPSDNLNLDGQNCIQFWIEKDKTLYDDAECHLKNKFICEYE